MFILEYRTASGILKSKEFEDLSKAEKWISGAKGYSAVNLQNQEEKVFRPSCYPKSEYIEYEGQLFTKHEFAGGYPCKDQTSRRRQVNNNDAIIVQEKIRGKLEKTQRKA